MKKIRLFVLMITAALSSCREEIIKEVEVVKEVEKKTVWKQKRLFDGISKIKTNSFTTNDHIYFYGPQFFSSVDDGDEIMHAFTRLPYPEFFRLPISNDFFIEVENEMIRLASTTQPVWDEGAEWIDMKEIAEDYISINLGNSPKQGALAISNANQLFVPIVSNNPEHDLVAYIFKVTKPGPFEKLIVSDPIRVQIDNPSESNSQLVYTAKAIGENFFFSVEGGTYLIEPDGSYTKVLDEYIAQVFANGNVTYGLKYDEIFLSNDNGFHWTPYAGIPSLFSISDFTTVGDSLVGYSQSTLFTLKMTDTKYTLRFLVNDGLETNDITSVSQFKDSVYVATYSGVFVRSANGFFDTKDEQE